MGTIVILFSLLVVAMEPAQEVLQVPYRLVIKATQYIAPWPVGVEFSIDHLYEIISQHAGCEYDGERDIYLDVTNLDDDDYNKTVVSLLPRLIAKGVLFLKKEANGERVNL